MEHENSCSNVVKSVEMVSKTIEDISKSEGKKYDCLICILRPIFFIGALVGVSPISYNCPHRKTSKRYEFSRSWVFYIITVICFLIIIIMLGFNVYFLVGSIGIHEKDKVLQLSTLVLFEMSTILLYATMLCQTGQRIKELNGLSSIIENKELFGIESMFFTLKSVKYFRKFTIVYVCVTITLVTVHIIHIVSLAYKYKDLKYEYVLVRGISSCTSLVAQILFIFQYTIEIKIYQHVLQKCYAEVKEVLNEVLKERIASQVPNEDGIVWAERTSTSSAIVEDNVSDKSPDITVKLQKLQRLHCAVIINVKQMNKFLNPFVLLTTSLTVLMLILSYYLLISIWMIGNSKNNELYYMLEFKTVSIIFAMVYLMIVTDSLQDPENDILAYLEGFPISKLKSLEALQVEMLITTVRVLRPQICASGVFNISIGLIASILSTIVSYVLVALQFRASWVQ